MKGIVTIPDIVYMGVIALIFGVAWKAIKNALYTGWKGADPMTQAVIAAIPALIMVSIISIPWVRQAQREEKRQRRRVQR